MQTEPALPENPSPNAGARKRVIAIDGPAASGKSTLARALESRTGFLYVNSGAMYRAIAWAVLQDGIDPDDSRAVVKFASSLPISCDPDNGNSPLLVHGENPEEHLRSDAVNQSVSKVSRYPEIRARLVAEQRRFAECRDIIMEGRDIGSVVFPDTPFKFYLDASSDVRQTRRSAEGQADRVSERDKVDASRQASPLMIADDAHVIDSSALTIDEVVDEVIRVLKERGMEFDGGALNYHSS